MERRSRTDSRHEDDCGRRSPGLSVGRSRVTCKGASMIASTRPSLSTDTTDVGVEIITLDGEFDLSHTPQIGYRMADILGACDRDVVIDLRGVCFLDSKMVRTLIHAFRQADQRDCQL